MKRKRGRPSAASLLLLDGPRKPLEVVERIKPPHDLTDEETETWHAVVSTFPADWFDPATAPILAQYCRHVTQARRLGALIERATSARSLRVVNYDRLLKMQQRESAAIASLATKMRITQQATTNQRGNKVSNTAPNPWE